MKIIHENYSLKNNIRVILIPLDDIYSFTIGITSKYGAVLEPDNKRGITHFSEHVVLNGTKSYKTQSEIEEAVERLGGSYNGSTSQEKVKFYATLPYTSLEFGINLIYEVLYEPLFNDESIENERKIIIDEITRDEDTLGDKIWRFENENSFQNNTKYKYSVLGTIELTKGISKTDLINHHKKIINPENLYIYIKGKFDVNQAKKMIEELFSSKRSSSEKAIYPKEKLKTNLVLTKKDPKTDLTHFTNRMILDKEKILENEYEELKLKLALRALITSGNSRLYKRLRQEKGLLYSIRNYISEYDSFAYTDSFFKISPENFSICLSEYLNVFSDFIENGLTEKEFYFYKDSIYNRTLMYRDTKQKEADILLDSIIEDYKFYSTEELKQKLDNMGFQEINKFIKNQMDLKNSNYYIFGSLPKNINTITKVFKNTKQN